MRKPAFGASRQDWFGDVLQVRRTNRFDFAARDEIEVRCPQAALFRTAVEDLLKRYEEPKKGKRS